MIPQPINPADPPRLPWSDDTEFVIVTGNEADAGAEWVRADADRIAFDTTRPRLDDCRWTPRDMAIRARRLADAVGRVAILIVTHEQRLREFLTYADMAVAADAGGTWLVGKDGARSPVDLPRCGRGGPPEAVAALVASRCSKQILRLSVARA